MFWFWKHEKMRTSEGIWGMEGCVQTHPPVIAPTCCQTKVGYPPSPPSCWSVLAAQQSERTELRWLPGHPSTCLLICLWSSRRAGSPGSSLGRRQRSWRLVLCRAMEAGQVPPPPSPSLSGTSANAFSGWSSEPSGGECHSASQQLEQLCTAPQGKVVRAPLWHHPHELVTELHLMDLVTALICMGVIFSCQCRYLLTPMVACTDSGQFLEWTIWIWLPKTNRIPKKSTKFLISRFMVHYPKRRGEKDQKKRERPKRQTDWISKEKGWSRHVCCFWPRPYLAFCFFSSIVLTLAFFCFLIHILWQIVPLWHSASF